MDIRVTDTYELRGSDLQWQVYEYKEVGKDDDVRMDWVPLCNYFASIEHALGFIFDRVPRNKKADRVMLSTAIEELTALKDDIRRSARRFEKGLANDQ